MKLDKVPLKSKKFIALFFIVLVLAILLGLTLFTQTIGWPLAAFAALVVVTIGTLGVGYILGQAGLDRYIAIAQAASKVPTGGEEDAEQSSDDK